MAAPQIVCYQSETIFQAFDRAVKAGVFPADAKLFSLPEGKLEPEAPAGYVTVGSVIVRPREAFAVGVPVATGSEKRARK